MLRVSRRGVGTGNTRIRMPRELHEQLITKAETQGVSLNTFMVALLAGGVGFKLEEER